MSGLSPLASNIIGKTSIEINHDVLRATSIFKIKVRYKQIWLPSPVVYHCSCQLYVRRILRRCETMGQSTQVHQLKLLQKKTVNFVKTCQNNKLQIV